MPITSSESSLSSWASNGTSFGIEKYFGTNDNYSIPIYTNGIARGILGNNGNFSFGSSSLSADTRFYIKGISATSSDHALKVDNSSSNILIYAKNDGNITIGKTLEINRHNFSTTKAFWIEANSIDDTELNTLNADLVFKTKYSAGNFESIRFTKEGIIKVADTNYVTLGAFDTATNKYGYLSSASNVTSGVGLKLEVCQAANTTGITAIQIEAGGNVGIGGTPLSKLYVNSSLQNESITLNNDDVTGSSYFALSQSGSVKAGMILLNSTHAFIPKTLIIRNLWDNGSIRINGGSGDTNIMYFDTTTFNVGIGTTTPATSALLDLTSTTGALLLPRMTTAQKNALTPTNGMIIYDTTLNKFQGYEAGAWTNLI